MLDIVRRLWFPITLVMLLGVALPGILLFALNLFGLEGDVNRWLMDSFQLSYHLPVPWWGVLLLLLVPAAIILLYFLKLKRKPLSVPSTFLWKKSIEDLHVNSLFQWLRENVLLLLQVLAVILLIYGVMAFHLHGQSSSGKHYILMIDNSASMSATDVAPSRLEWAKQEALKEIDAATDNDFGMIIEFNDRAEIKQSYTGNRGLLRQAVKDVRPTQRPTRIEEAITLADSLANPVRSTENAAVAPASDPNKIDRVYVMPEGIRTDVHLFSDGRFPDLPESVLGTFNSRQAGNDSPLGNLNIQYHAAGSMTLEAPATAKPGERPEPIWKPTPESSDNVAIVTFNARRDDVDSSDGRRDASKVQILIEARNFRDKDVDTEVDIDVYENGQLKDSLPRKPLRLPARTFIEEKEKDEIVVRDRPGRGSAAFELSESDSRKNLVLHARLVKVNDKFPLDDEAWLVIGVVRKARVLIVTGDNEVLRAFFEDEATRAVANVDWLTPADLDKDSYRDPARNGVFDLVIFDRCAPADERELPRSNTFFIGRPPPPWKLAGPKDDANIVDRIEFPHIKGWDSKHSLMRYLSALHDVGISDAFLMKDMPPRSRLIETDRNGAVLVNLVRGPFTDLVLTFALINDKGEWTTNWPLLPSFPIFLRNVLYQLGNVSDAAADDRLQPGGVKVLRPDSASKRGVVTDPDGKETKLEHGPRDSRTDFVFSRTDRLGPYRVQWQDGVERNFAVNLLDTDESTLEPRPAFQIGSVEVKSGPSSGQPREIWRWFALLALIVLLIEWYIYNRRVYV